MILRLALRNLRAHKVRTVIVGGLLAVFTFILMVSSAMSDALFAGMRSATVNSMTGHLQVYDENAKDELAVFGSPGGVEADIGEIPNFGKVRDALLQVDNVKSVVPLGTGNSIIFGSNTLDVKLGELRAAVMDKQPDKWPSLTAHIRKMVQVLREDLKNLDGIVDASTLDNTALALADEVGTEAWWKDFEQRPLEKLELLDNKIAPLATQGRFIFFRYVGTDPQAFADGFSLFKIDSGEVIPKGRRGVILNRRRYEREFKNRIANKLDEIKEARADSRLIADDDELQTWVKRNVRQRRQLLYDMTPPDADALAVELAGFLKSDETDLDKLLEVFLETDDANFDARYDWFYAHIAPRIVLYRYGIGDYITVTGRGRTGFAKSVNLKIYGTFTFDSLEKSQLAGGFHIIDMISFRELYGRPTAQEKAEMKAIAAEMNVKEVSEDEAEEALFGEGSDVIDDDVDATTATKGFDEFAGQSIKGRRKAALAEQDKPYTQEELDTGLVKHAAVLLEDPTKLDETVEAIDAASANQHLAVQTSPWTEASGIVGGFTQAISVSVIFIVFLVFVFVLIIINNSIVMATMDRTQEIGTIRAIGGQRGFILRLFLSETLLLGLFAALIGVVGGSIMLAILQSNGLQATDPILYFLFGGPRLYPTLQVGHGVVAVMTVLGVTFIATLYPAWLAARIEPVVAMRGKD